MLVTISVKFLGYLAMYARKNTHTKQFILFAKHAQRVKIPPRLIQKVPLLSNLCFANATYTVVNEKYDEWQIKFI